MINFWLGLRFLFSTWILAFMVTGLTTGSLLGSAVFFSLYFLIPLMTAQLVQLVLYVLPILVAIIFFSESAVWLIYLILAMVAGRYFTKKHLTYYTIFLFILAVFPFLYLQEWLAAFYTTLLAGSTIIIVNTFKQTSDQFLDQQQTYEKLDKDYQLLKRQLIQSEQVVRQEERNQIARELHDSVGHRLTALLMQTEAARLQTNSDTMKETLNDLKKLAQTSLQETRSAVQTLKSEETSGIQAIIQIIRKMEMESQLRLTITIQSGVLGTVLTNQQSVATYRSIQEALTNMMRHSGTRQAIIEFQIVGNHDLRFSIRHPITDPIKIKEGFGLTNMRMRLAELDGRLTIQQQEGNFEVTGQFPLKGEEND